MLEKHGIACDLMHGFHWDKWTTGKPTETPRACPRREEVCGFRRLDSHPGTPHPHAGVCVLYHCASYTLH